MASDEIHVGNIGTALEVAITDDGAAVDVSGADTLTIYLTRPDGTVLAKTAVFSTDGEDGRIECSTAEGDLDQSGVWKIQGRVITGSTSDYWSKIGQFAVHRNSGGLGGEEGP